MRMKIKYTAILLAVLVAFPCGFLKAQDVAAPDAGSLKVVKGIVTDAAGEPLYQAVITDAAGKMLGSVMLQNSRKKLAPSSRALSTTESEI